MDLEPYQFVVDIRSKESVAKVLADVQDYIDDQDGEEFIWLEFGRDVDGEFQELQPPEWELQSCSVQPLQLNGAHSFFYAAAEFGLRDELEAFLDDIDGYQAYERDEAPLGTDAICALVRHSIDWIPTYITFLSAYGMYDMLHDCDEMNGIDIAIQTYGWTPETLDLLAVRMFSAHAHHGGEMFQAYRSTVDLDAALEDDGLLRHFEAGVREEAETYGSDSLFAMLGYPHDEAPELDDVEKPLDRLMWKMVHAFVLEDIDLDADTATAVDSEVAVTSITLPEDAEDLDAVAAYPNLQTLKANHCRITDLTPLQDLQRLRILELQNCPIASGWETLTGRWLLTYLDLAGTPADDETAELLVQAKWLRTLDLSRTKITDAAIPALSRLYGLGHLWIADTQISETGVAELRKALPHTTIFERT